MATISGIPTRMWGLARGAERHWLRPLLQRMRVPRFRRRRSRRPSEATEELLVALLRSRLRAEGPAPGAIGELPAAGPDVDALVHGLLAMVAKDGPVGTATAGTTAEAVTLPIGLPAAASSGEGRRRAA